MKRYIIVESCKECPYHTYDGWAERYLCNHPKDGGYIFDFDTRCPLDIIEYSCNTIC